MSTIMTTRKANADRKLIDSQLGHINRDIEMDRFRLIALYQANKPIIDLMSPEDCETKIKSNWQKLNDLLIRREKLNAAVMRVFGGLPMGKLPNKDEWLVHADGTDYLVDIFVEVPKFEGFDKPMVNKEKITIAQAIARKNYYNSQILNLVDTIRNQAKRHINLYNNLRDTANEEYNKQINAQFGPESSITAKQRIEYADSIKNQYLIHKIDPLNLVDKIETVREQILEYVNTIDSVLSHATETFQVEIED